MLCKRLTHRPILGLRFCDSNTFFPFDLWPLPSQPSPEPRSSLGLLADRLPDVEMNHRFLVRLGSFSSDNLDNWKMSSTNEAARVQCCHPQDLCSPSRQKSISASNMTRAFLRRSSDSSLRRSTMREKRFPDRHCLAF